MGGYSRNINEKKALEGENITTDYKNDNYVIVPFLEYIYYEYCLWVTKSLE